MTDGDLVRQTLAGRTAAYGELARRWSARILALCHAKAGRAHCEDLAQESLLRGFRALATLSEPEKFGPWLRGIAVRVCLDWLKARQTHQVSFGSMGDHSPEDSLADARCAPDEQVDHSEQLALLMNEVQSLPEEYREVLLLYYYQDATYRDLAEQLGVSSATINARLTKARAMLRERLRPKVPLVGVE
jgi:RNA polymerase sigma-70 factor (ECF subfamily)